MTANHLGHLDQRIIAHLVTLAVIVFLEIIDIEKQQGDVRLLPQPCFPYRLQLLVEIAPVVQAGQAIALDNCCNNGNPAATGDDRAATAATAHSCAGPPSPAGTSPANPAIRRKSPG
jgi:hypothetical protein